MNRWKFTAILFMVLFILVSGLLIYIGYIGFKGVDNENKCMINVCGDDIYDAWNYDWDTGNCRCYNNNEIIKTEYLG